MLVELEGKTYEFPDGTSMEEIARALETYAMPEQSVQQPQQKKQPIIGATQAATPAAKQTADILKKPGPSVGPTQAEIEFGVTPEQTPPDETKPIKFKDLHTDPTLRKTIKDYMVNRMGKEGHQKKDETDEEYARRFTKHMRDIGTDVGLATELTYMSSATKDQREKAMKAAGVFEDMASFYEEGGEGFDAFIQNLRGVFNPLESPTTYAGLGVGAIASKIIKRGATKKVLGMGTRSRAVAAGAGIEGSLAGLKDIAEQRLETERIPDEQLRSEAKLDLKRTALQATVGAVFGATEVMSIAKPKDFEKDLNAYKKAVASKQFVGPLPSEQEKIRKALNDYNFDVFEMFDPVEGRRVLDKLSPEEELVNSKIKNSIGKKVVDLAGYIILSDVKKYGPRGDEKISDAVRRVIIEDLPEIDEVALEGALSRAGIDPKQFMDAARTTLAEAASIMNAHSQLAKKINTVMGNIARVDPEAEELFKKFTNPKYQPPSVSAKVVELIKRGERESVAFSVSAIITTVRNVYGTTKALTFDAAASLLEKSLWSLGSSVSIMSSKGAKEGTKALGDGLRDAFGDSFRVFGNMMRSNETRLVVDDLLKYNPKINEMLFSAEMAATQTASSATSRKVSELAKFVNTFNAAQDGFLRRSIFLSSVQNRLREVGMDPLDFIANNRAVPPDVLKNAADDALKATFSYQPKNLKKEKGFAFESLTADFLKFFEQIPGSTLVMPFPRFMANAVRFQYRYSPIGGSYGAWEMGKGIVGMAKNAEDADVMFRQGFKKLSQGMVGMAALYAAYKYRQENQDTQWYEYKKESGDTADFRGDFPTPVYLAVADFLVKSENLLPGDAKLNDIVEQVFGIKMGAGTQNIFLDNLAKMIENSDERTPDKLAKITGDLVGEFFGRFTAPLKSAVEVFALIDADSAKARDPNVSSLEFEGEEGLLETLGDSTVQALKRVANKLPIAKEVLPEAVDYFSRETPSRPGEFFTSLTGTRVTPARNRISQEFVELGIEPYRYYKPSGVRAFDRLTIENALEPLEKKMFDFLSSKEYPNMTTLQRRERADQILKEAVKQGRDQTFAELEKIAGGEAEELGLENERAVRQALFKFKFFSEFNPNQRALINEAYKEKNGVTLEKAGAYEDYPEYEGAAIPIQPYQSR